MNARLNRLALLAAKPIDTPGTIMHTKLWNARVRVSGKARKSRKEYMANKLKEYV